MSKHWIQHAGGEGGFLAEEGVDVFESTPLFFLLVPRLFCPFVSRLTDPTLSSPPTPTSFLLLIVLRAEDVAAIRGTAEAQWLQIPSLGQRQETSRGELRKR